MQDSGEGFAFELQVDRFRLAIRGRQIDQVAQYLADAIGVVGEPIGTVKDAVSRFRIHRAEAATAALIRAREKSEERESVLAPPSPKILAPWLEGASSEDLSGDNILELWAEVLSRNDGTFDPILRNAIDVLNRIGASDAETMEDMLDTRLAYRFRDESARKNLIEAMVALTWFSDHNARILTRVAQRTLPRWGKEDGLGKSVKGLLATGGVQSVSRSIIGTVSRIHSETPHQRSFAWRGPKYQTSCETLEICGIARRRTVEAVRCGQKLQIEYFEPTDMGIRITELLIPEKRIIAKSVREAAEGVSIYNFVRRTR